MDTNLGIDNSNEPSSSKCMDHSSQIANALLKGELVILDFDDMMYHSVRHTEGQTFQDLATAMGAMRIPSSSLAKV